MIVTAIVGMSLVSALVLTGLITANLMREPPSSEGGALLHRSPYSKKGPPGTPSKKVIEMGQVKKPDVADAPLAEEKNNMAEQSPMDDEGDVSQTEPETVQAALEVEVNQEPTDETAATPNTEDGRATKANHVNPPSLNRHPRSHFKKKRKPIDTADAWATNPFRKQ